MNRARPSSQSSGVSVGARKPTAEGDPGGIRGSDPRDPTGEVDRDPGAIERETDLLPPGDELERREERQREAGDSQPVLGRRKEGRDGAPEDRGREGRRQPGRERGVPDEDGTEKPTDFLQVAHRRRRHGALRGRFGSVRRHPPVLRRPARRGRCERDGSEPSTSAARWCSAVAGELSPPRRLALRPLSSAPPRRLAGIAAGPQPLRASLSSPTSTCPRRSTRPPGERVP